MALKRKKVNYSGKKKQKQISLSLTTIFPNLPNDIQFLSVDGFVKLKYKMICMDFQRLNEEQIHLLAQQQLLTTPTNNSFVALTILDRLRSKKKICYLQLHTQNLDSRLWIPFPSNQNNILTVKFHNLFEKTLARCLPVKVIGKIVQEYLVAPSFMNIPIEIGEEKVKEYVNLLDLKSLTRKIYERQELHWNFVYEIQSFYEYFYCVLVNDEDWVDMYGLNIVEDKVIFDVASEFHRGIHRTQSRKPLPKNHIASLMYS